MPRKLLCLGHNAVSQRVGVMGLFPGASTLLAVRLGGSGLGLGFNAPDESADVDLFSAVRAVHAHKIKPNSCLWKRQFKVAHYRNYSRAYFSRLLHWWLFRGAPLA